MTRGSPRRRFVLVALAFVAWAGAMWGGGAYFTRRAAKGDRELPVYAMGGERLAAGEEIYRRGADAKPFTYPPFAAVPFVPFSWLPRDWQPAAWFAVNFHLLLGIVFVLQRYGRRQLAGRGPPRLVGFWLLTLGLGGHHVASVFSNQSHDLLIAGLAALTFVGWARGSRGGRCWAAACAGIGAAIKATPLLFLGLFLVRYRWLAAVVVVATFGVLSWSPDLLFPRADGGSWFKAWIDVNLRGLEVGGTASAAGAWNAHSYLNQGLSGTLTRLLTPAVVPGVFVDESAMLVDLGANGCRVVTIAGQLAVLGLLTWAARAAHRAVLAAEDAAAMQRTVAMGEIAAFVCGMVLLSPQSSKAHFCIWLFPAAYLADRMLRGPRDRLLWPLAIAAFVMGPMMSKGVVGREFGNLLLARGNVTWATVLLLLATVRALRTER